MSDSLYPAPRWFRETVQEWLRDTPPAPYNAAIHDLWTRIAKAQPPNLRVVAGGNPLTKGS